MTTMNQFKNQQEFLEALRKNDRKAWKYLNEKGFPLTLKKAKNVENAKDILQNALINL